MYKTMLDYSILSTHVEDIYVIQTRKDLDQLANRRCQHTPNPLQYLGLNICIPRSLQNSAMTEKETSHNENTNDEVRRSRASESLTNMTKDLDDTMVALQDKINELFRLDDELCEYNKDIKHTHAVSPTGCRIGIKDSQDITTLFPESANARVSETKGNFPPTAGEPLRLQGYYSKTGSHEHVGAVEGEADAASKVESLLETSFRITERVRQKARSVSFARRNSKTHEDIRKSLTCSRIDSVLKRRTKHPLLRIPNEQIQPHKERRIRTIANKRESLIESSKFAKETSGGYEDLTKAIHQRLESPISCCCKESESGFVPYFQGHPLETLFKDRRQIAFKKKSKRARNVLRLLDCKRSLCTTDDTIPKKDRETKALSAFINRRRSVQIDDRETHAMFSSYLVPNDSTDDSTDVKTDDRANTDNEGPELPRSATYSYKNKVLQTLRMKKGLVSFSNFKNAFGSST